MFPLMNLIITKWLLVYVLENKHNFHVIIVFHLKCFQITELQTCFYLDPLTISPWQRRVRFLVVWGELDQIAMILI